MRALWLLLLLGLCASSSAFQVPTASTQRPTKTRVSRATATLLWRQSRKMAWQRRSRVQAAVREEHPDVAVRRARLTVGTTATVGGIALRLLAPATAQATVTSCWSGIVLAISFVEAWLKFQSPFLPKCFAFDVGRTVFPVINALEMALCATAWSFQRGSPFNLGVATLALASQVFLLTPKLRKRAAARVLAALEKHPYLVKTVLTDVQRARYVAALKARTDTAFDRLASKKDRGKYWHVAYVVADVLKLSALLAIALKASVVVYVVVNT